MDKKHIQNKRPFLLWIALFIVILLIAKFSYTSWSKYKLWVNHKSYFEQPRQEQLVQTWMTPHFINRRYEIKFDKVTGVPLGFFEARNSLDEFCKKHSLDCKALTTKLDSISKPTEDSPLFD